MTFRPKLIDELLKDYRNPEDLMGVSIRFNLASRDKHNKIEAIIVYQSILE